MAAMARAAFIKLPTWKRPRPELASIKLHDNALSRILRRSSGIGRHEFDFESPGRFRLFRRSFIGLDGQDLGLVVPPDSGPRGDVAQVIEALAIILVEYKFAVRSCIDSERDRLIGRFVHILARRVK